MGKKKNWSWLDYNGMGKGEDVMDRYNVAPVHYGHPDGRSGRPNRTMQQVDREIAAKASKDYDTRRTLETLALRGNEDAEKWAKNGFKDGKDVAAANKMFEKLHKKNGNGGEFSSLSDFAGLTHDSVVKDRDALMSEILKGREPKMSMKEDEPERVENPYADEPEGLDPYTKATNDYVNGVFIDETSGGLSKRVFPMGSNLGQVGTGIPSPGAESQPAEDDGLTGQSFAQRMKQKIIRDLRAGMYGDEDYR